MSKHLKRLAAPRAMPIPRKIAKFTLKPSPGPHPVDRSLPLGIIVRDILKLCDTGKEAKKIIKSGEILVDGRVRKDIKFPCGLMDVISIPKLKKSYRVLFDQRGKLTLVPIDEKDAGWKLCRVENKTTVKGGKTQLNLHDGRNILIDNDGYKTGDVIKLSLKDNKITDHYPMEKGILALITGGKHIGEIATIEEITITRSPKPNLVSLKGKKGIFSTIKDYVFPVGKEKPAINLPEVRIDGS